MTTHLTDTTFDAYLSRALVRSELRRLDEHVPACADCSLAVEAAALQERRWARRGLLGRLVRR
jgi:hypothetical protein